MKLWIIAQLIGFNLFWFVCVLGQNKYLWLAAVLLAFHFIYSPSKKRDLMLLPIAFLGMAVDTSLSVIHFFDFNEFPYWLALLWLGFVVSLSHSLAWLNKLSRPFLLLVSGISGASSYLAGAKFGAVNLSQPLLLSFFYLAVIWMMLLPVLLIYEKYISHQFARLNHDNHNATKQQNI